MLTDKELIATHQRTRDMMNDWNGKEPIGEYFDRLNRQYNWGLLVILVVGLFVFAMLLAIQTSDGGKVLRNDMESQTGQMVKE